MIVIAETKRPRKVSGRTSFLVTFPYDPKITEAMKALPLAAWLRADQAWEIPADSLAQALDSLTFLSDIKLSLLREGEESLALASQFEQAKAAYEWLPDFLGVVNQLN